MHRPQPCCRSSPSDDTYEHAAHDAAMKLLPQHPTTKRGQAPLWWFFSLPTICERLKSLLYSFPLSPSSSGQGRHPFKVDIAGSNPLGAPFAFCTNPLDVKSGGFVAFHVVVQRHYAPLRRSRSPVDERLSAASQPSKAEPHCRKSASRSGLSDRP